MTEAKTIVLYHGDCPDGFGGAYAAWKKFGDAAEYVPLKYGKPIPDNLADATVYFIDVCYPQEIMDRVKAEAASLIVLDHHQGTEEIVKSVSGSIYDSNRSGASIAWHYFHPDTPLPELLSYVEDDDLYRFNLPDTRAVLCYLMVHPFTFESWDKLAKALAGDIGRKELLAITRTYAEYFELLADSAVRDAKLVEFEGMQCYFATAHPNKPLKSLIGNLLAQKTHVGLVVTAHPEGVGVSIRSDGTVDVAAIARKYGGNGHPKSAGFRIEWGAPLPWKMIEGDAVDDQ